MKTSVSRNALPLLTVGALCTTGLLSTAFGEDVKMESIRLDHSGVVPGGGVAGAACEYSYDDGVSENAIGAVGASTVAMSNAFTALPGCLTVNSVNAAWGPHTEPQPVTVGVYADPNNDGDPTDVTAADLVASAVGMTSMGDTDTFVQYAFADVELNPGDVYHVIAITEDIGDGEFPLAIDTTASQANSWLLLGIGDTNEPFTTAGAIAEVGAGFGLPGNFMVRLGGTADPPNCPTDIIPADGGNGATDVDDLVGVILDWGCEGDCVADVPGISPGVVDVDDLVAVILAWGPCPVANNTCDTAQFSFAGDGTLFLGEISCDPVSVGFNNVGASNDGGDFSCATGTADVWFEVPFNCTGKAVVDTNGSDFDTVLEVYGVGAAAGDDCAGLVLLGCDNDSGDDGTDSRLEIDVTAGSRLYIRVGGGDLGSEGAGTLNLCCAEFLPDPPPNDDCANAIALAPGESDSQQTDTAADDPEAFPCGQIVEAPGAWYSVTGTGNTMTATLCVDTDYDSKIFVYCAGEGGDPCVDLACIAGDDDGCGTVGGPSEISWCSENAREYLVFVSGWGGATGNYTLSIDDDAVGCGAADECIPNEMLANDNCTDAIPIVNGLTDYSTLQATSSDSPAHPDCSIGDGGVTVHDIWFTYTVDCPSEFGLLTVSTCEDVGATADYDTDIVIYDATSGTEMTCGDLATALLGCSDDNCPIGAPAAPWHSHAELPVSNGQQLIIRIGGYATEGGDLGAGTVLIDCVEADNDFCSFATEVDLGGGFAEVQIDNCDATVDDLAPICGNSAPDAPGRWLTFIGDGSTITVAVCNLTNPSAKMGMFVDSRLTAYCGAVEGDPCGDLKCATEEPVDNGACPFTEELTFCTEPGRTYFVLCQGATDFGSGCEGVMDLTFTVGAACGNPPCPVFPAPDSIEDAFDITEFINGETVISNNSNATPPQHDGDPAGRDPELPAGSPSCQWAGVPDDAHNTVWYQFTAPGNGSITAQTCNGLGDINDTVVTLYSGTPGSLVEVGCDEDGCNNAPPYYSIMTVTGLTPGETYYLCVANTGSWGGSTPGEFELDITSP